MKKNFDMPTEEFRKYGHELIDWIADYLKNIDKYPVLSKVSPNSIINNLPKKPPEIQEEMSNIINDFKKIIIPGITHWNHPGFMAYFNSTASSPGILGELLSAALNINGMLWKTSPASTELEIVTINWIRQMLNLPSNFFGVIYDLASISSLHAIATAREAAKELYNNYDIKKLRIYGSEEAHSSIEKGIKTLGLESSAFVKIKVDKNFSMKSNDLKKEIIKDFKNGLQPFCVVGTFGTTSTASIDPIKNISKICKEYNLWFHIDAAYGGSAAIIKDIRSYLDGVEYAQSIVINPHKWMFVPIDLSILFTTKADLLKRAFSIVPHYLKTNEDNEVINFMDYGIQLGRRFRSLKLWFVIRYFGSKGLQNIIGYHIQLAKIFAKHIDNDKIFIRLAPVYFSTVTFRAIPSTIIDEKELDNFNKNLIEEVNNTGKIFLSHTKVNNIFAIRLVISGIRTTQKEMENAWKLLKKKCKILEKEFL